MKRLLLISLLVLSSGPAYAEWMVVGTSSDDDMIYIGSGDDPSQRGTRRSMGSLRFSARETVPRNDVILLIYASTPPIQLRRRAESRSCLDVVLQQYGQRHCGR